MNVQTNKLTATAKPAPKADKPTDKAPAIASVTGALSGRVAMKMKDGEAKAQTVSAVKQRLAEAADAFKAGDSRATEATQIADKAGVILYQGLVSDWSMDEVNSIIGDAFGFQKKGDAKKRVNAGDPEASKTPYGKGNFLRMRVVRMAQAVEHVTGSGDGTGQFFASLPKEADKEVAAIVEQVESGEISLYSAHDKFAALKGKYREPIALAFDPKKIAQINESLGSSKAVGIIGDSDDLLDEYAELLETLGTLNTALGAYLAKKDAAAKAA